MPYTDEAKALMLWHLREVISHMSLHNGLPPAGHELPTGIYQRKAIDLREPANGEMRTSHPIQFDIPEGSRVAYAGFWTNAAGGVLLAWAKAPVSSFRGRGIYEVDLATMDLNAADE